MASSFLLHLFYSKGHADIDEIPKWAEINKLPQVGTTVDEHKKDIVGGPWSATPVVLISEWGTLLWPEHNYITAKNLRRVAISNTRKKNKNESKEDVPQGD